MSKPNDTKVLVLYTGGTIGMCPSPQGYKPVPGYFQTRLKEIPQFSEANLPDCDLLEMSPLLDSANMSQSDWNAIAQQIMAHYQNYDAFIVLHGTDTMSYSASALSFMLEGLDKAVIFTGSQIPLAESRSDAQDNLLASMTLLNLYHDRLQGVFVYFNHELILGNRSTKISADSYQAFDSPNFPALARVGIHINVHWELLQTLNDHVKKSLGDLSKPNLVTYKHSNVAILKLFPGISAKWLDPWLDAGLEGLVIECFGAGNAPDGDAQFLASLKRASDQGIVLTAITQPMYGTANLDLYATGQNLKGAGVLSGFDMTAEAAYTKLCYLLSKYEDPEIIKEKMPISLRGELTNPNDKRPDIVKQKQAEWD